MSFSTTFRRSRFGAVIGVIGSRISPSHQPSAAQAALVALAGARGAQRAQHRGQVDEIAATHLDQTQTAARVAFEQSAHGGGLAGAALSVEQHVVEGQPAQELLGVLHESLHRLVDADQVVQVEGRR